MNSSRTRIGTRGALFIAGALLMLTGAFVSSAQAGGVSGVLNGRGAGTGVETTTEGGVWAGQFHLTIDGDGDLSAYCIDFFSGLADGDPYEEGDWSEANIANLGKVTWVLGHGFPMVSAAALAAASGATDLTDDEAAAATQMAVWFLTDGLDLDASNDADLLAAYHYLITSAVDVPEPPATLTITPASLTGEVGQRIGPFTVATTGGPVNLTSASGAITDAGGNPLTQVGDGGTFYITPNAPGTVVVDAAATATLFYGRVFLGLDPEQQALINIQTADTHTSVSVSVDVHDTTTSSSTSTTSTSTTSTTSTTTSTTSTTSTTTSTTQPTTSTTEPATTDPTTTVAQTTTTEVGSETPTTTTLPLPVTTTTDVGSEGRVLPRTGSDSSGLLLIAAGLALIGSSLVLTVRRARP